MKQDQIKLNQSSILKVPFDQYDKDFLFIVNGEEFKTSRIIADLLSPKICQNHLNDTTNNEFIINTNAKGDFSLILNLINFDYHDISNQDIPFLTEVLKILENDSIEIKYIDQESELTLEKAIEFIKNYENFGFFSSNLIDKNINYISSHFYEIKENENENLLEDISPSTIYKILTNTNLQLDSEDQLITVINHLYSHNSNFHFLYEYVNFENISKEKIIQFLNTFDINDLTNETWRKISVRLQQDLKEKVTQKSRYFNKKVPLLYSENSEFNGIVNYIKKDLKEKIKVTSSSILCDSSQYRPENAIDFDDHKNYCFTATGENEWVCLDFDKYHVIPLNYTIRSHKQKPNNCHPKNWVIEGSNDTKNWSILDTQNDCSYLNGSLLSHTFTIQNQDQKEFQYLRMRQTGPCWDNSLYFCIDSIEFYGYLI